jgi:hypothetical protein
MADRRFCDRCDKEIISDEGDRYEIRFQFLVYRPKELDQPDLLAGDTCGYYCEDCVKVLIQVLEKMGIKIRQRYCFLDEFMSGAELFPEQFEDMKPFDGVPFEAQGMSPDQINDKRAKPNKYRGPGR